MDVAIVGAGPAGAWAALKLARAGARVSIFDPSHPREKPCGGGLTGRVVELVERTIGPMPIPSVSVQTARLECALASPAVAARPAAGESTTFRLINSSDLAASSLVVVDRTTFDHWLLGAAVEAGASLVNERVIDVGATTTGVSVRTRRGLHRAETLLGADGATSLVRRRFLAAFDRRQISVGTGYFVDGVTSNDVAIRWMSAPHGYLWSFPRHDHLAVGACAHANEAGVDGLRQNAAGWIRVAALARGDAQTKAYAWPIPTLGAEDFARLPVAGRRWLLLGDAAGLVDPLTREGIYYALLSGDMAAAAIVDPRGDTATSYREQLTDTILGELRRAAALKRVFFSAEFSRHLVHAVADSAAIRSVMVNLFTGRQPYIGLRRRLLCTLRFDLAWKAIRPCWALALSN